MKVAIDLVNRKIVDIMPDNTTASSTFLTRNNYILLDIDNPVLNYTQNEDDDGVLITTPVFREVTDAEIAPYLLSQENKNYETAVSQLTSTVPQSEIATWTKQESEARAYLLDNTVSTPLIDSIATARGIGKDYLVAKIIEKADAYAVAIGILTGIRQAKEKDILGL